ncbi:MAG: dTDP-4-dehydrorhamnose reductase [Acidobacteria bacterium]|nr:MAG: dTDP-4-dehydrorhamnose reductase [Acidobacteriota bacterium]
MVGRALVAHCQAQGDKVLAHERADLDITNADEVYATLERERPETVINCAAWTDVDGCELNPERALTVNAEAVETLALASRQVGASFVTISTDYVFAGDKAGFYTQRDDPEPQSAYGMSKLQGERRAQVVSARTMIVRTSWVFGPGGKNFLTSALARARRGEQLPAIGDAYGTPTYAPHLAARLRELAALDLPGVYHVAGSGAGTSFAGFARAAVALAGNKEATVAEVSMDSLQRPAPRPRNSRLRCLLSAAIGLAPLPDWQTALREFAETINAER